MLSSQRTVQIFSPERSFAQIWFRTPRQSVSLSQGAQNLRFRQTLTLFEVELLVRTVEQKYPEGQSTSPLQPSFVQYASISPSVPMHWKPLALSQSSLDGPCGHPDPNCPKSRGNESSWQVRTGLPSESLALPVQLPIDLQRPCVVHETQSSWTSHVYVQVRSMQ
jgi:hypothetical protein